MSCVLPVYKVLITCVVFVTGFLPARDQFVTACCDVSRTSHWPGVLDCCGSGAEPLSVKEFGFHNLELLAFLAHL